MADLDHEIIEQNYSTEVTYFAKVVNGRVVDVIRCSEQWIREEFHDTTPGKWIETRKDGSIRKNYASIGHYYDVTRDAFYREQPFPSWVLNEDTCRWEAPIPMPSEGYYEWNEEDQLWVEVQITE